MELSIFHENNMFSVSECAHPHSVVLSNVYAQQILSKHVQVVAEQLLATSATGEILADWLLANGLGNLGKQL